MITGSSYRNGRRPQARIQKMMCWRASSPHDSNTPIPLQWFWWSQSHTSLRARVVPSHWRHINQRRVMMLSNQRTMHSRQHKRRQITFKIPHLQHQFRSNLLNNRVVTPKSLWTDPPPEHLSLIRMTRAWLNESQTPLPAHPITALHYFNHMK